MTQSGQRPRALPLWLLPLAVLILLLVAFGILRAFLALKGSDVVVVAKDAAPGQVLTQADLQIKKVNGYGVDSGAVFKKVDDVVGHIALDRLAKGSPVSKAATTDVAAPAEVAEKSGLHFRTEGVTVDEVETGARVDLLFAPTGGAGAPRAQVIGAILLAHPEDGKDGVVWVAIDSGDREALLGHLARSRLIIAPAP
jgi:hypothetical protein